MTRTIVTTSNIAAPVGPFSAAVVGGPFLFLSGQVAQDPDTGKLIVGGVGAQTERIFQNVASLLAAANKDLSNVVKVTVFLTGIADFPEINEVYGRYFEKPFPARTTVAVTALPLGANVELDIVAQ
jgi:2-iminobutanoate/2-iminopropanoate deaminase